VVVFTLLVVCVGAVTAGRLGTDATAAGGLAIAAGGLAVAPGRLVTAAAWLAAAAGRFATATGWLVTAAGSWTTAAGVLSTALDSALPVGFRPSPGLANVGASSSAMRLALVAACRARPRSCKSAAATSSNHRSAGSRCAASAVVPTADIAGV
jgi:hypothetical protein